MFDIYRVGAFIKQKIRKKDIFFIGIITLLYFLTRLINLEELPIFNDEGIYIHWAKVAWHDASWRFISLTDGKQPLQTWGTIPFLKLFPNNALIAGRLFSVATGFFALSGMFALLHYLFNRRTAYIGSLLYVFIPYFVFYDRMAMVDSGVNGFFIWILFFSILLVKTMRFDVALIFGMIAGMGLLAKSSVRVFVGLSLLAPILIKGIPFQVKELKKLFSFITLFGISAVLAITIYNVQRLSPFLHFVEEKNKTFVMTFTDWIQNPFAVFFNNLKTVPYYVFFELGWIIVPFALFGLLMLWKKDKRLALYLSLWIVIPYIGISFMTRVLFPRYIIFFGSLITILTAYFFGQLKNQRTTVTGMGVVIFFALIFNYFIWFDYKGIIFPPTDRGQYIEGITVGYGAKEIIEYARNKATKKPVVILAEGNFGMSGDILDTFLRRNDTISIVGYWPLDEKKLENHQKELVDKYVFVVLSHQMAIPKHWPVKLIQSYYKPNNTSAIFLLELMR